MGPLFSPPMRRRRFISGSFPGKSPFLSRPLVSNPLKYEIEPRDKTRHSTRWFVVEFASISAAGSFKQWPGRGVQGVAVHLIRPDHWQIPGITYDHIAPPNGIIISGLDEMAQQDGDQPTDRSIVWWPREITIGGSRCKKTKSILCLWTTLKTWRDFSSTSGNLWIWWRIEKDKIMFILEHSLIFTSSSSSSAVYFSPFKFPKFRMDL